MLEAVMLLPCLVMLLLAGRYLHGLGVAADGARARARRCVWSLSMAGCDPARMPQGAQEACQGLFAQAGASPTVTDEAERVRDDAERDAKHAEAGRGFFDAIEDWPVLGDAFTALFGAGQNATTTRAAPVAFGDGPAPRLAATQWALCNETGHSPDSVAGQLFALINPF